MEWKATTLHHTYQQTHGGKQNGGTQHRWKQHRHPVHKQDGLSTPPTPRGRQKPAPPSHPTNHMCTPPSPQYPSDIHHAALKWIPPAPVAHSCLRLSSDSDPLLFVSLSRPSHSSPPIHVTRVNVSITLSHIILAPPYSSSFSQYPVKHNSQIPSYSVASPITIAHRFHLTLYQFVRS